MEAMGYEFLGNIFGAVAFAILIYITELFNDSSLNSFLLAVVEKKCMFQHLNCSSGLFCVIGLSVFPFYFNAFKRRWGKALCHDPIRILLFHFWI